MDKYNSEELLRPESHGGVQQVHGHYLEESHQLLKVKS